jgi:hypothetical protein
MPSKELGPTSQMAWENRLALDMRLATKGGVCIMIGALCCTYIPNNTAPDGTVTKALQGLTTLANEIAENSAINDPFTDLMENWFERWTGWMTSIFTFLIIVAGVLILAGCCIIPCVRGLIQRLIEAALTKYRPPQPYQNNLFLLETQKHESQQLLNEFEEKNLKEGEIVRKMIFSIKVFVTLLAYLKIPQVIMLGDLHV